jgi:hypothetical protein
MVEPTPPTFMKDGFDCPWCHAYAQQIWQNAGKGGGRGPWFPIANLLISECGRCGHDAYWFERSLIWPLASSAPLPNADLPEDVTADYVEAAEVLPYSPRSSAALLRLAIQKLCGSLHESTSNLNGAIGELVKKGLSVDVQQALDIVRVIGNNAVHPGAMDLRDDAETAGTLFGLVNLIADRMLSEPKRIAALYERLPEGSKKAIAKRDTGDAVG